MYTLVRTVGCDNRMLAVQVVSRLGTLVNERGELVQNGDSALLISMGIIFLFSFFMVLVLVSVGWVLTGLGLCPVCCTLFLFLYPMVWFCGGVHWFGQTTLLVLESSECAVELEPLGRGLRGSSQ